jgi:hypothetical protein
VRRPPPSESRRSTGHLSRMRLLGQRPRYQEGPPRGPATWRSPRWGRGCQADRGSSRSLGGGRSDLALRRPWPRRTPGEGTPDRSKLFGSLGQRPWFHEVMRARMPTRRRHACGRSRRLAPRGTRPVPARSGTEGRPRERPRRHRSAPSTILSTLRRAISPPRSNPGIHPTVWQDRDTPTGEDIAMFRFLQRFGRDSQARRRGTGPMTRGRRRNHRLDCEALESRQMLSGYYLVNEANGKVLDDPGSSTRPERVPSSAPPKNPSESVRHGPGLGHAVRRGGRAASRGPEGEW